MVTKPTEIQEAVLCYVKWFIRENHFSPTIADVQYGVGDTYKSATHCKLKALRKKGYLTWRDNVARTIRPTRRK